MGKNTKSDNKSKTVKKRNGKIVSVERIKLPSRSRCDKAKIAPKTAK